MKPRPLTIEKLCIHQVTLMQCDFRQSIDCLARHGVTKTAVWRDKLDEVGTARGARILRDSGVESVSLCPCGLLTAKGDAGQRKTLDNNKRWLDQAAEIGASTMVTITGGLEPGDKDIAGARGRVMEMLDKLLPIARAAGIVIALEPLHPMVCSFRSVTSTLREANSILDDLSSPSGLGIALDTYALWWEYELQAQITRAGDRIVNLHVSDWLQETSDIRLDRGMIGDGHIDNTAIRHWAEASGFEGPSEVEIFSSSNWWKRASDDVVSTIVERAIDHL